MSPETRTDTPVLVFDLDDTLYVEETYVLSGFRAVARHGLETFGWNEEQSFKRLEDILRANGRGQVFDIWLREHGHHSRKLVRQFVNVYRAHQPRLNLAPAAEDALNELSGFPMYLVTDGHKEVQARKVAALGLFGILDRVYITHRFGIQNAKPSTYCFEKIRARESCGWNEMLYVGDNPKKDFVNLNPLGVHTVRVLTGMFADCMAEPGYDGRYTLSTLQDLPSLVREIRGGIA